MSADRHNFGQHVEPMERASFSFYQKPRTVFWEWLFFDRASPLRAMFDSEGENSRLRIADAIFNLDVESRSEWSGTSKRVFADSANCEKVGSTDSFARFGMLMGYAYIFGIRDLHHQNLIRCAAHLQVIDAEVVFANLILPHETLLLPFKDVSWKECGLSLLAPNKSDVGLSEQRAMMAGFLDVLSVFDRRRTELIAVFNSLDLSHPIRIILRNTRDYVRVLNQGTVAESLLLAEERQLLRGDVPYFFKRLGSPDVFWVSKSDQQKPTEFSTVPSDDAYAADIARHAVPPSQLPSAESRMVRGALFLHKQFGIEGDFIWRDRTLKFQPGAMEVEATGKEFRIKT